MGNRYNQQQLNLNYKPNFLPILCSKSSIKDVVAIPKWDSDRSCTTLSSDPLSPKIGCMGQMKLNHEKLSLGFSLKNASNPVNYFKLRKILSGKNSNKGSSTSTGVERRRRASSFNGRNLVKVVDVVDMDPPLPVTRKVKAGGKSEDAESLWKRRCGSVGMSFNGRNLVKVVDVVDMDPPLPVTRKVKAGGKSEDAGSLWKRRCGSGGIVLESLRIQEIRVNRNGVGTTSVSV